MVILLRVFCCHLSLDAARKLFIKLVKNDSRRVHEYLKRNSTKADKRNLMNI